MAQDRTQIADLLAHVHSLAQSRELEKILHAALKGDKSNPEILTQLAHCAAREEKFKLAADYYALAIQFNRAKLDGYMPMPTWDRARVTQLTDQLVMNEMICRNLHAAEEREGGDAADRNDAAQYLAPFADRMLETNFEGIAVELPAYIDAAKDYLARFGRDTAFSVFASGKSAEIVLNTFQKSELAPRLEGLFHDVYDVVNAAEWPAYKGTVTAHTLPTRITFVHVAEDVEMNGFIRSCVAGQRLQMWGHNFDGPHTVVFLNRTLKPSTIAEIDHPYPIVLITTPYAGRTRFMPTFHRLANAVDRTIQVPAVFTGDAARHVRLQPNAKFVDDGKYYAAMNLEYYEILEIHRRFPWQYLHGREMFRAIMLMRDPRDMCVSESMFHHAKGGKVRAVDGLMTHWLEHHAKTTANDFLAASASGAYLHKFEDLNKDEKGSWRTLLAWLGWHDRINDEDFDAALYLGSFEHQTGGRLKRGESEEMQAIPGALPLRKGASGDWKNRFADTHKKLCKDLIGPELVRLGYEQDLDW